MQSLQDTLYIPRLLGIVVDDEMTFMKAILGNTIGQSIRSRLFEAKSFLGIPIIASQPEAICSGLELSCGTLLSTSPDDLDYFVTGLNVPNL
jgi:hypothetical protein